MKHALKYPTILTNSYIFYRYPYRFSLLKCNKRLKLIMFMEFANRAINVIVYAILLCRDADTNIKFIFAYSFIAGSLIYPEETYSQK